jgi:2-dehydro-3-deoxy-L-rhamnonate dehydrogenase (NAD+)
MTGVAVVTGGAGGIGQALLARLGRDGFQPVSWDLRDDAPNAALALKVDVTGACHGRNHRAARANSCRGGECRHSGPGCARVGDRAAGHQASARRQPASAFLTVRAVVPRMLPNPGPDRGRIVLIAPVQGKEGTALAGPYAASKAGMLALAKVLGKELAEEGILVNAIAPAVVRTRMLEEITAVRREELLGRIPMRRFLAPEEVAAMASWLCGPECTFSTGAVFDLSGGRSTY